MRNTLIFTTTLRLQGIDRARDFAPVMFFALLATGALEARTPDTLFSEGERVRSAVLAI